MSYFNCTANIDKHFIFYKIDNFYIMNYTKLFNLTEARMSFYITEKAAEYTGLLESARLYSSEIEYSDENKEKLLDIIYETEV